MIREHGYEERCQRKVDRDALKLEVLTDYEAENKIKIKKETYISKFINLLKMIFYSRVHIQAKTVCGILQYFPQIFSNLKVTIDALNDMKIME